jgi:positive regulator of sigma E activity
MALVASIAGALVGFAVGAVLTEIVFSIHRGWSDVVPFALAVAGWLVARQFVRWRRRKGERGIPSTS